MSAFQKWCSGRDSNPHGLLHTPLKRARLPITPPELILKELSICRRIRDLCSEGRCGRKRRRDASCRGLSLRFEALKHYPAERASRSTAPCTIKTLAETIVILESTETVPRGPKAAFEILLVNNAPASVLPGWSNTEPIRTRQEIKYNTYRTYSNIFDLSVIHYFSKAFGFQTRPADQCTVNIVLGHQLLDIVRFYRSAV